MIWDKLTFLQAIFPTRAAASEVSRRWHRARRDQPQLALDLIRLGGILTAQPLDQGELVPPDPIKLAYEAGRRDLALQLLAMTNLSMHELNTLMEDNDVA